MSFAVDIDLSAKERAKFKEGVRLVTATQNKETLGYRVESIVEGSHFSQSGLQVGDLIVRVNDLNVKDRSNYRAIFNAFKEAEKLELQIVREPVVMPQIIQINFNIVEAEKAAASE